MKVKKTGMELAKKLQVQTTRICRVTKRSQYNFISDQYDALVKEQQEFSKIKSGQGFSKWQQNRRCHRIVRGPQPQNCWHAGHGAREQPTSAFDYSRH